MNFLSFLFTLHFVNLLVMEIDFLLAASLFLQLET
jgi:hypothetical protein